MSGKWLRWPRKGGAEPIGRGAAPPDRKATPQSTGKPRTTRRRYSAERRQEIVTAYRATGQSRADFCVEHDVAAKTLARWLQEEGVPDPQAQTRQRKQRRTSKTPARPRRRAYTPEERRQAIEAFESSKLSLVDFCRTWGVSTSTLTNWQKRYREEGPKGLEPRKRKPASPDDRRRLPAPVKAAIVGTKQRHPDFGVRRVRDALLRFSGIKVSMGSIVNTLREAEIPLLPKTQRRPRRRRKPPRRFERSRPSELWQSDITSYVLARPGRRVYLVVFLDDNSRYIVGWCLHHHQKQEIVTEALLSGISAFGKPLEVLTDQGRQYYAWRGKSQFQKLLEKEGIAHVVSRPHHPQTLGKCERLWKTIGEEFWERAKPQDLDDARTRLSHFISHYNHFRPHQGINGLVPADRFFGVETMLRQSLEKRMSDHELQLALEEPHRRSVYLFGQVGEQKVSLHGQKGRLVIRTEDGEQQTIGLDELGVESRGDRDGRAEKRAGYGNGHAGGVDRGEEAEANASVEETHTISRAIEDGASGARALATGARGGQAAGAPELCGDPGVVAGQDEQAGSGGETGASTASGVAALPAGAFGYAGGASGATQDAREGADHVRSRQAARKSQGAEEADRAAGGGAVRGSEADRHPQGAAGEPGSGAPASGSEADEKQVLHGHAQAGRGKKEAEPTGSVLGSVRRWLGG